MKKFDRTISVLILLQSKKYVKAAEIAERFEISLRTVYRDIRTLEDSGVPIGVDPYKGYFIVEGYHLPPIIFSNEEASAILVAEKLLDKMSDKGLSSHFRTATEKIKTVLSDEEKNQLEVLNSKIEVFHPASMPHDSFPNNFFPQIQYAVLKQYTLRLKYYSYYSNETNEREVEPLGIVFYSNRWHLIAFCTKRNDFRDFRFDRIENLTVTTNKFEPKDYTSIEEFFESNLDKKEAERFIIKFDKEIARYLHEAKHYYGFISEREIENKIEMTFFKMPYEFFAQWLISFAEKVEIVSPKPLIDATIKLAERVHKHYVQN